MSLSQISQTVPTQPSPLEIDHDYLLMTFRPSSRMIPRVRRVHRVPPIKAIEFPVA